MIELLGDIAVATGVSVVVVLFIAWTIRGVEAVVDRTRGTPR